MPLPPQTKQLIIDVVNQFILPYLDERDNDSAPVLNYVDPKEMHERVNKIMITDGPASNDDLKTAIAETLDLSVKMGHKKCLNQLFHRADPVAILGDFITSVMNTSIYTYELAPMITVLELEMIDKYRQLLNWVDPSKKVSGTMTPGGSFANCYGIVAARHQRFPHVAKEGWKSEDKPCFFVSDAAHYSSKKTAGLIGIGYDALIPVATCPKTNTMDPAALRIAIQKAKSEGKNPFCVVATVGTTLTGAVDPIQSIVQICKDEQIAANGKPIWIHLDAALGGGLLHSTIVRASPLFAGLEQCDSITINPHKMMGSTLQTTMFLTQHGKVQVDAFSTKAQYLFNEDKQYDAVTYDVGDQVFQCGRHVDVFKLFMMWKARGDVGMSQYVDVSIARNELFNKVVKRRCGEFQLLLEEPSKVPATCFFYIPKKLQTYKNESTTFSSETFPLYPFRKNESPKLFEVFEKIAPRAKLLLMRQGTMVLTFSKMGTEIPNFWRFVANGAVDWTEEEYDKFLDEIAEACETVYEEVYPFTAVSSPVDVNEDSSNANDEKK